MTDWENYWRANAIGRGVTIAKLQRTIARQREHIRAQRKRLQYDRERDIYYARLDHYLLSAKKQANLLIAEITRLRDRNHELEVLHSVMTTHDHS